MKNSKLFIILFVVTVLFFSSCSNDRSVHIPKDAFFVAMFDGNKASKFYNKKQASEAMQPVLDEIKGQLPNTEIILNDFIDDINSLGIEFSGKSYLFAITKDKNVMGMIIPIKRKKLEENINIVAKDFNLEISALLKEKNGIKYFELPGQLVIGWNNKTAICILGKNAKSDIFEEYFNLKRDESILVNSDYKEFKRNCKDYNLWISSDVITHIEDSRDLADKLNSLTGIDLTNNYGHVHFDIQLDEISMVSKLKFNKSVRNFDPQRIMENADDISWVLRNLIDEVGESLRKLSPYNYDYYNNSDYYEEYLEEDIDVDYDYDLEELINSGLFTDEEIEELKKELDL